MADETTLHRLLRRACNLMGRDIVAATLTVPPMLLDAWMSGHASIPERKFLVLADALDKHDKRK